MKIEIVVVRLKPARWEAIGIVLAGLVCLCAYPLASETLTMVTTYPSPMGVYKSILSTDQTTLARASGNVSLAAWGGNVTTGGNVAAAGNVSAVVVQLTYQGAVTGASCASYPNGSIALNASGILQTCWSGVWQNADGY